MPEIICPMDRHPWEIDSTCNKEKCAWWIDGQYRHDTGCALFVIANALTSLVQQGKEER